MRLEWESLGLGVLSGLLYALPFVFRWLWPLAWFCLVPVGCVYALDRYRRNHAPGLSPILLMTGVVLVLAVGLPVSKQTVVGGVVFPLFYLPFPLLGFWVFRLAAGRTRVPLALLLPAAWVLAEWSWSRFSLGATAFLLIGYTQFLNRLLIQFADLTGVPGVSFLLVASSGAILDVLRHWLSDAPADWRRRNARFGAIAIPAAVLASLAYGVARDAGARITPGPRIALVQPNLPHRIFNFREVHTRQMGYVAERLRPGMADLIALPENALQDIVQNAEYYHDFREVGSKVRTPILLGANGIPPAYRNRPGPVTLPGGGRPTVNEAVLLSPEGEIVGEFIKIHLLPFSEALPLADFLGKIHPALAAAERRLVARTLGFAGTGVPGTEVTPLPLATPEGTRRFWVPICFESANSGLAREAARRGADFFINITSEALLGPQIYWNMIAICTFRAVENRVGIARATNSGISCFIGPDGRIGPLLTGEDGRLWDDRGILISRVGLDARRGTFFTRTGDWFAYSCVAACIAVCLASWLRRDPVRPPSAGAADAPSGP